MPPLLAGTALPPNTFLCRTATSPDCSGRLRISDLCGCPGYFAKTFSCLIPGVLRLLVTAQINLDPGKDAQDPSVAGVALISAPPQSLSQLNTPDQGPFGIGKTPASSICESEPCQGRRLSDRSERFRGPKQLFQMRAQFHMTARLR